MLSRRRTTLVSTVVLLAGLIAIPPATVQAAAPAVEPPAACGGLTSQFQGELDKAKTSLVGIPPNPAAATEVVGGVVPVVTAMQGLGCLPAVPPEGGAAVTPCVDAVADLLAKLFGTLAALISPGLPDVAGALTQITGLIGVLTKLITEKCLPVPVPPVPAVAKP